MSIMATLAALGVASNIMQVVSSSWELIKIVLEIRRSGSTAEHSELRRTTTELKESISKLRDSSNAPWNVVLPLDDDLSNLAVQSMAVADDCCCSP
jgi:hypothetical protein